MPDSILSPRTILEAQNAPTKVVSTPTRKNVDISDFQYVEVPVEDLFGKPFGHVSINFEQYPSGKHFVDPETAGEINRLVKNRQLSDMRIMQPNRDKEYEKTMALHGKPAANMAERF
jgi:hypothetical protein